MRFFLFTFISLLLYFPHYAQQTDSLYYEYNLVGEEIISMQFHPFSSLLAIGTTNSHIVVFDVDKKSKVADLYGNNAIFDVKFSPNGDYLAVADASGIIRLWRTGIWRLEAQFKFNNAIVSLAFDTRYEILYAGDSKGNIFVIRYEQGEYKSFMLDDKSLTEIYFCDNIKQLVVGTEVGDVFFFNPKTKISEPFLISDNSPIISISSYQEEIFIYFVSRNGRIRVFDKKTFELSNYITSAAVLINTAKSSVLTDFIVLGTESGNLLVYNLYKKRKVKEINYNYSIKTVTISNDMKYLVLAFLGGKIEILDLEGFLNNSIN